MLSKEDKTKILDYLEKLCETSRVSKKTLGYTLRSYHVSCPFVLMILLAFGSKMCVMFIAASLMIVFLCFFYCNGCILTMLEHRLCGDEYTIADPFIEMLGIEINSQNRVVVSYFIAIGYFTLLFLIFYYRFYFNKIKLHLPAFEKLHNEMVTEMVSEL
jgi:hypothetical protein